MNAELRRAAIDGDTAGVTRALDRGEQIDRPDHTGQTALMLASHRGHLQVVQALIDRGADLDVTAKFGLSATMLAVIAGHAETADALIAAGADLAIRGTGAPGFAGLTAEQLAAGQGMPWPPAPSH